MSIADNKAVVTRLFVEGWAKLDASVLEECVSAQYNRHHSGAVSGGQFDAKRALEQVAVGIPDLKVSVELILGEGDLIAVRSTTTGTHSGRYLGIEASGNRVEFTAVDFYRLKDGKIVESWHNVDEAGLLRQLLQSSGT
jgi:predicted ester cyclase